jgi:exodeoxyribonuclease VII small subunit
VIFIYYFCINWFPLTGFNYDNLKMSENTIKYSEAIKEIEDILRQIENEELDVDDLSAKVKQAYFLLRLCKEKLHATEKDIENIMKDFSADE